MVSVADSKKDGLRLVDLEAYFFSSFGAGAPSLSLLMLPFVALMPVVSIEPSGLAPLVVPGFSMPVCGAGPVFCAKG
jgi:hypothetical protein